MESFERQCIAAELVQLREEGCDVAAFEPRVEEALEDEATDDAVFVELYDALEALSPEPSFPFEEPSDLEGIRALRPDGPRRMDLNLSDDALRDRILGAWLGRAAGCQLGKPVEGWLRERIDKYLESTGALPLDNYIPYTEDAIHPRLKTSTLGNFDCMARDDDMDYPILGLLALEEHGAGLTSRDMANTWLDRMPFHFLYTAERVAYRNFVNLRWPPESAAWRNPYREWIGAQIRADIFGYVAPGWPEKAAELAFRDASISHVKNGIYGEMFMAAMLAASFVTSDVEEIIKIGLSEIPANCRLAEAVHDTAGGAGIGVLNDRLMSCVRDCNDNRISELAERTHRVAPADPVAAVDGTVSPGKSLHEERATSLPGTLRKQAPVRQFGPRAAGPASTLRHAVNLAARKLGSIGQ